MRRIHHNDFPHHCFGNAVPAPREGGQTNRGSGASSGGWRGPGWSVRPLAGGAAGTAFKARAHGGESRYELIRTLQMVKELGAGSVVSVWSTLHND